MDSYSASSNNNNSCQCPPQAWQTWWFWVSIIIISLVMIILVLFIGYLIAKAVIKSMINNFIGKWTDRIDNIVKTSQQVVTDLKKVGGVIKTDIGNAVSSASDGSSSSPIREGLSNRIQQWKTAPIETAAETGVRLYNAFTQK